MAQLTNLTELRLDQNQLTTLPDWMTQLTNLTELSLGKNQLTALPEWLGQFTNLTTLRLNDSRLTTVPEWLPRLTNLTWLDLGRNQLTALPEWFSQFTNLTWLGLSGNELMTLPEWFPQLTNLRSLHLGRNQLTTLPESMTRLTNLDALDLGGNRLTILPEWFAQLTNLRWLHLSNYQLTTLPEWMDQLTNLTHLHLGGNRLTTLPKGLTQLANLTWLNLGGNQITTLPEELIHLTNLDFLDLSGNQLTSLPEWFTQFIRLTSLNLSRNRLTALPDGLSQLANLDFLDLSRNRLTALPDELSQFTNLDFLDLSRNQLTTLPEGLTQLAHLTSLNLDGNHLISLPDSIVQLTRLTSFDLSNNHLTTLPDGLSQLTRLTSLSLSHNKLTTLPDDLAELTRLTELNLNGNRLSTLPEWISQLTNLTTLTLDSNPLHIALQSAYDAGLDELRAYLQSLDASGQREYLYEAKLVLVGEGGVGKTTLLKALTGGAPRAGEPTTHGVSIDIQALRLPHPDQPEVLINFNAWDFGGQEVYRVTHQFFFSPSSVYLLIWEPRRGAQQSQVEDWLKILQLRVGAAARVILVSTHCRTGERIARIDKPELLLTYGGMIVDFLEVDSMVDDPATGEKIGIAALKAQIARTAKDLAQMGMPFNRSWREARDALLAMPDPCITYPTYATVCAGYGLSAVAARTLAVLMHDLGYIVYYGDDPRLKDDVVLQPEWLTKAIGFVLEDRGTQEFEGILPDERLRAVWWDHPFQNEVRFSPELYPFFLRLMEKFDVSYRLENGTASLVAQHVPQVRPDGLPWLPEEDPAPRKRRLVTVCQIEEVPPGLIPWMIVRTHRYSSAQSGQDGVPHLLHWQKGMFLRDKGSEALLELRDRELHINVEAVWPTYFLDVLGRTLEALITQTWPGLEGRYTFTVPCRQKNNGQLCSGRFDIAALHQFLKEGDDTIRCQVCRTRQEIAELLFGFDDDDVQTQLDRIEATLNTGITDVQATIGAGFADVQQGLTELESRLAYAVMTILNGLASEAKDGPRLFTLTPADGNWHRPFTAHYNLRLWCEMDGCQHPVIEPGFGDYNIQATREWVGRVAPAVNLIAGLLKTLLPMVAPAANSLFGPTTIDQSGLKDQLDLAKEGTDKLIPEIKPTPQTGLGRSGLSDAERTGLLALHAMLREVDPHQQRIGLQRVTLPTGDYRWLCPTHYGQYESKIPDTIE